MEINTGNNNRTNNNNNNSSINLGMAQPNSYTPPTVIAGTFFLVVATVLQIVGTATHVWVKIGGFAIGLFQICDPLHVCARLRSDETTGAMDAVRAFTILAILGGFASMFLLVLFLVLVNRGTVQSKTIPICLLVFGLVSGGSSLLGCIVFIVKLHAEFIIIGNFEYMDWYDSYVLRHLGFSFYLCVTAGILLVPAGILLLIGTSRMVTLGLRSVTGHIVGTVVMCHPPLQQQPLQQLHPGVYIQQQPNVMVQGQFQPQVFNAYSPPPYSSVQPAQAGYPAQAPGQPPEYDKV